MSLITKLFETPEHELRDRFVVTLGKVTLVYEIEYGMNYYEVCEKYMNEIEKLSVPGFNLIQKKIQSEEVIDVKKD